MCSWKPLLRDLQPASVLTCYVYGFRSVPSWCYMCFVLFQPIVCLETSIERLPACCSAILLCIWLPICAFMVSCMLCPVQGCCVPGNQCWHDLPDSVLSCCVNGFWSVPSWCFECCVLFRPVLFLETSVEIPPACCSPVLLCLWLLMCAVGVFWVLCPVPAGFVPGNQCWDTSCLLQSPPVVSMDFDLCRHGVLSVVSCSDLLRSWKPVLRYLLFAAVPSCCVYGFWSVPSCCFECYVLFRPVIFLANSVERTPACFSPVLLCNGFWSVPSGGFECCVLFRTVVFLETSVERLACFSPVLSCIWLPICAFLVFCVLCPVQACFVPGN